MANTYFQFRQFIIHQDQCAMKVTTDGCLFGAWVAAQLKDKTTTDHLLDIGAGSGLLSLMVHQQLPQSRIDAVEIDTPAATQAAMNIDLAGKKDHISVHHTDILRFSPENKYDYIFSNPPFYEKELKGNNLQKNTAHHNDGLRLQELVAQINRLLKPEGHFYLLLPFKRREEISSLLNDAGCRIIQWIQVKPAVHLDYFRLLIEGRFGNETNSHAQPEELSIKNKTGEYTTAFTGLLKPYYLYL